MLKKIFRTKKSMFLLILIFNIILSIFFLVIETPFFSTVDDSRMRDIVSGAMTGTPDGHLVFIQYTLGAILKWLYTVFPIIPWYAVMMIANIILSLSILLYSSLSTCKKRNNFIFVCFIYFIFYVLFFRQLIVSPQFTTVASIIGCASIVWYLHMDFNQSLSLVILSCALCVYLACMSFMYRKLVFIMLLPLILIIVIVKNYSDRKIMKVIVINVTLVIVTAGSLFCIKSYDDYQYSSQEYTSYRKFNQLRSYINDYYKMPNYDDNKEIFDDMKISKVQYDIIANYSLMLGDDISIESLEKIVELQKTRYNENRLGNIKDALKGFLSYYQRYITFKWTPLFSVSIAFYLLLNLLYSKRWKGFMYLGAAICMVAFGSIYFIFSLRFPQRLAEALWIPLTYIIMFVSGRTTIKTNRSIINGVNYMLLGLILILGIYCTYRNNLALSEKHNYESIESENYIYMIDYSKKNKEEFFYYYVYSFANATDELFPGNETQLLSYTSLGGWLTRSPLQNKKYEQYGFTSTMDALTKHDNVYLAVVKDEDLSFLEEFANEKYPSYQWKIAKTVKNGEILLLSLDKREK